METEEPRFPIGEALFEEAFNALLPRFLSLAPSEVIAVNRSVPVVVPIALGMQARLHDLKERLRRELPDVDPALSDELGAHALALSHAHTLSLMARHASDSLEALAREGMKLRAVLFDDANALVKRGVVDGEKLRRFRGSVGYRNLAFGLPSSRHWVLARWPPQPSRLPPTSATVPSRCSSGSTTKCDGSLPFCSGARATRARSRRPCT